MVSKRSLIRSLKSSIFRVRPGSMKFILLGPDITLKNFPRMFYISLRKVYRMDRRQSFTGID